ncbi:hypothetical protein [Stutzerimonas stutzeri]|uniref:Holin n=1 Tax=Stutzerimonas stutzeri TaxID=316 RepID=A0AA42PAG5_STUST|nr:hypothetical protein [Stutzerimonas stutzeri]MDH1236495.1 hypothetical protein [Stutzerimonas stutzeri]
MPWRNQPDLYALVWALLISFISGFISIAQRIARGYPPSKLWILSEFSAAVLAGYLMADAYPVLAPQLPEWATLPIMVALAAHIGGRAFQGIETALSKRYRITLPKPGDSPGP